jgi:hypothetical protein
MRNPRGPRRTRTLFFQLSSWILGSILLVVLFGAAAIGLVVGSRLRGRADDHREPIAAIQSFLLTLVGLILAFSLALAVGRYEARRAAVVQDANAIGTTYLRAQTLSEPIRTESLRSLRDYVDVSIRLSGTVPGSPEAEAAVAEGGHLHRELWSLAGQALDADPVASAPRLYVETLNEMIDMQTVRVRGLNNRVPPAVLAVELVGAALALALLAAHLSILGRAIVPVFVVATLVTLLLLVTFDLDRPTRGLIQVPPTALTDLRASMELPPAAPGPAGP